MGGWIMGDLQCTETPLHDTMFVEQVMSCICEALQNCERENVKNIETMDNS